MSTSNDNLHEFDDDTQEDNHTGDERVVKEPALTSSSVVDDQIIKQEPELDLKTKDVAVSSDVVELSNEGSYAQSSHSVTEDIVIETEDTGVQETIQNNLEPSVPVNVGISEEPDISKCTDDPDENEVSAQGITTSDKETKDEKGTAKSTDDEIKKHDSASNNTILTALNLNDLSPLDKEYGDQSAAPTKKLLFSPSRHKMSDTETPCMVCDHIETNMNTKSHYDEYLCHLLVEHRLVIADVKLIADLQSYAIYWKKRFKEEPLEAFCSKIVTNTGAKDVAKSEEYFLLCDHLPEDKKIREELQFKKLQKLLLRHEFERNDETFSRRCPFCIKFFQGNRLILFNHMTVDHNFNIGHPDNIVNVRELLDEIQLKLDALQCLFCENTFRDRATLREHMRKKGHRRLNPKNKDYDKYYTINYLELGKNWQVLQGESEKLDLATDDWSGWYEDAQKAYCFFCTSSFTQADKVYDHMNQEHDFDFLSLRLDMQLSFYQQIKLVNYIRREVHFAKQQNCLDVVSKIKDNLKNSTKWNQPQYYFSTYEDDSLLCQLEDKEGLFEPEDNFVIGEDGIDCRAIVNNSVLTDLYVQGYFEQ